MSARRTRRSDRRSVLTPTLVALSVALLLASLSLVTWRQARALEALAVLDGLRSERALVEADIAALEARIQRLESRAHVVPAAERLGMHVPTTEEMVDLSEDAR